MPKASKSTTSPFSMRFTSEERAILNRMSAGLPLAEYIRRKLLSRGEPTRGKQVRSPTQDETVLIQLLGQLMSTHVKNNLKQLSNSVDMETLKITPGVDAAIDQATTDIGVMREFLVKPSSKSKFPINDHDRMSRLLGDIRGSDTPDKLNQIAKAVNTGELVYLTKVSDILTICADIAYWRSSLALVLGLKE